MEQLPGVQNSESTITTKLIWPIMGGVALSGVTGLCRFGYALFDLPFSEAAELGAKTALWMTPTLCIGIFGYVLAYPFAMTLLSQPKPEVKPEPRTRIPEKPWIPPPINRRGSAPPTNRETVGEKIARALAQGPNPRPQTQPAFAKVAPQLEAEIAPSVSPEIWEIYHVLKTMKDQPLTRASFEANFVGGQGVYRRYCYDAPRRSDQGIFNQMQCIRLRDGRGTWEFCKSYEDILRSSWMLERYARSQGERL